MHRRELCRAAPLPPRPPPLHRSYAKLQSMLGELVDGEEELARLSGSDPAAAAVARRAMADVVGELSVARRGAP